MDLWSFVTQIQSRILLIKGDWLNEFNFAYVFFFLLGALTLRLTYWVWK